MTKQLTFLVTAATVLMLTAAAAGQSSSGTRTGAPSRSGASSQGGSSTSSTKLSAADEKFVKEAAEGGVAEVQLGRLAASNAMNPEVKQFGQRMVDDHGKANMQLMTIANQKNIAVASDLTGKHKDEYDRLSKLSGAQFDREYVRLMLADHQKDVAEFRKQSTSAKDSDLRSFASQTLPTLEQHLMMVQQLSRSASESTGTSGSNGRGAAGSTGTGGAGAGTGGAGTGGAGAGTDSGSRGR
jgi:putative membrane protein